MSIISESKRLAPLTKIGIAATCGTLACTLGVGTAAAYLTGTATSTNPFTLDTNLKISLTEPSFVPASAQNVKPAQTVSKDPTITNTGSVPAYIAVDVKVPVFTGKAVQADKIAALTNADLFSYTTNTGWSQLGTPVIADGFRTYRYVYNNELAAGAQTSSLFNFVTLANLTEDVGITNTSIGITAYAIQSEGFASAAEASGAYDTQAHATVSDVV